MKKIAYILSICFLSSLLFVGGAIAAEPEVLTTSNNTIVCNTGGYPDLEGVNVSPNVTLSVSRDAETFQIIGYNTKGNIEYGVESGNAYIFFQEFPDTGHSSADYSDTLEGDWARMGLGS